MVGSGHVLVCSNTKCVLICKYSVTGQYHCRCSESPASEFVCASQDRMVVQAKTQGFILVWAERPYLQFELSCSCTQMFAARVTNGREREQGSQVSGSRMCVCSSAGACVRMRMPLHGVRPPFTERVRERAWGSGDSGPLSATERWVPLTYLDLARERRPVRTLLTQYSSCPHGNGISACQPDFRVPRLRGMALCLV